MIERETDIENDRETPSNVKLDCSSWSYQENSLTPFSCHGLCVYTVEYCHISHFIVKGYLIYKTYLAESLPTLSYGHECFFYQLQYFVFSKAKEKVKS